MTNPQKTGARQAAKVGPRGMAIVIANVMRLATGMAARLRRRKPADDLRTFPAAFPVMAASAVILVLAAAFLDPAVTLEVRRMDGAGLLFMRAITDAAKSTVYLVLSAAIVAAAAVPDWRRTSLAVRRRLFVATGQAAFVFAAIAGPGIAINIAKQIIGRGRPQLFADHGAFVFAPLRFDYLWQSFPSGHATTAGSIGMIIALFHPRLGLAALALAAILALARIPAGAHYLSDVVAGYAIGTLSVLALAYWLARRRILFALKPGKFLPRLMA